MDAREPCWPATLATFARRRGLDPGDVAVWFGDEARIGQKNKITRRWTRHSAPSDQRTASAAGAWQIHLAHADPGCRSRRPNSTCGTRSTPGGVLDQLEL